MKVQILLTSGAFPRYFGGFAKSQSGKTFVIATRQIFDAKHYSVTEASKVLDVLLPSWSLAQISHSVEA